MVNEFRYDWESMTSTLPSGVMFDYTSIKFKDGKEHRAVYGKGPMPRGAGRGNYSGDGEATLQLEEWERFLAYLAKTGVRSVYRHPLFDIVVSYRLAPGTPIVTRTLRQVRITEVDEGGEQGAEKVDVNIKFLILGGIERSGLEPDLND